MDEQVPFKNLHSREYSGHKKKVHSVAWNCIGTKLASGSVDQTARIWHIEPHGHGKVKDIELKGHTDSVDQLCWDPKHADLIATASGDKTVRLWDARNLHVMSEDKQTSEDKPLSPNDLKVLQGSYRLDGGNYLQWARLVRTTLKGQTKLNHIEGDPPAKTDPKFEVWDVEDALIITWLWESMTPELSQNCLFFSTAKEIWEDLSQMYSMKKDTATCYEIQNRIFNTKQGSLSVTDYYGTLNGLWIKLDQYQSLKMTCTADSVTLTQFIERARIFKFLSGLNSEFDPIRVQILGKEKLPSLIEVFCTVRREETRRSVMLHGGSSAEGSSLGTAKGLIKGSSPSSGKPSTKFTHEGRWCSYCRKTGHTKETCYKLHGKEKDLERIGESKSAQQRRANQGRTDSKSLVEVLPIPQAEKEVPTFSKEELERLQALIDSLSGKCSQQAELSGENINITYKPDGTHVAVGNRDDELTILDVRKFKPIHRRKFNYEVNEIAWNMTGEMFFLTTGNGTVEVLSYPSLRPLDTLMAHTAGCYCIAIDPTGRYFAVGSADSLVSLWDISEMLCVRTFTKLEWPVRTISFNHTGDLIASASEDLFIDISNVHTGKTVHQIPCRAAMNSVEWNPKCNLLAYAGDDKNKYQADEGVFRIFGFENA